MLQVVLNGGVTGLEAARQHLAWVDGVMIGRAAYQDPYLLAPADMVIFGDPGPLPTRQAVLQDYLGYAEAQLARGVRFTA